MNYFDKIILGNFYRHLATFFWSHWVTQGKTHPTWALLVPVSLKMSNVTRSTWDDAFSIKTQIALSSFKSFCIIFTEKSHCQARTVLSDCCNFPLIWWQFHLMTDTYFDLFTLYSFKLTLSYSFHLLLCARDIMRVYCAMYSLLPLELCRFW